MGERTQQYDKLVRTGIPDIIRAEGKDPNVRDIDNPAELLRHLGDKGQEELSEVIEAKAGQPTLEELADLAQVYRDQMVVLDQLGQKLGFHPSEVEAARAAKEAERGGFLPGVYLISTSENTTTAQA